MLKQYSVPEAQKTILKRIPLNDVTVPPSVLQRTAALFGEPLSPYQAVERILADVRRDGDAALRDWTIRLDGAAPNSLRVPPEELRAALDAMPSAQRKAFELAAERVLRFHQAQPVTSWMTQSLGGTLGQFIRPIRRIGLYVPGGTAPLPSSLLMSVCPAQAAGVKEIAHRHPAAKRSGAHRPQHPGGGGPAGHRRGLCHGRRPGHRRAGLRH